MKKRLIALGLAVLMIAAAFTVYIVAEKVPANKEQTKVALDANDVGDGIFYTLDDNARTATVGKAIYAEHNTSGYTGGGVVVIPDIVTKDGVDYAVKEIGRNAFDGSDVEEVLIYNSVVRIGEMAFADCAKLERVAMGTGVLEIAGFAFWHCPALVDVSLGKNVKSIGGCAFWSDISLEVITIPQSVTTIMEKAFADCLNLKKVVKADSSAIAANAFDGIETAPEIVSSFTPFIYAPTVYAEAGAEVSYRLLLEGNPGGIDVPREIKVNGEDKTLSDDIEFDNDSAYNGTVYVLNATVDGDKDVTVEYNASAAAGAIKTCDHSTTGEVVTKAATCTEAGSKDIICSKCGKVMDTVQVDALGHNYVDFVIEAVCLDGGYTTHKCSRCGDLYKDAQTEPTGHSWGAGTISSMPTHSATGVKKITCDTCKRVETLEIPVVGDVNGDGKRNSKDVIALMKYIVGIDVASFSVEAANCDGKLSDAGAIKLNSKDVIALMKATVDETRVLPSTPVPTAPYER